ncbi:unnamed protein product [Protopolystoma xenopodis]|uniref:Uncharacterized protein n=1 Tax=Protopolystoma xenopodis TaxID=117903 RepID=A0A448X6N0_9PLAT|nr:unnamed protein product [Protopolystoma xenopodis]
MSQWIKSQYPDFRLGRNTRVLASQSVERLALAHHLQATSSIHGSLSSDQMCFCPTDLPITSSLSRVELNCFSIDPEASVNKLGKLSSDLIPDTFQVEADKRTDKQGCGAILGDPSYFLSPRAVQMVGQASRPISKSKLNEHQAILKTAVVDAAKKNLIILSSDSSGTGDTIHACAYDGVGEDATTKMGLLPISMVYRVLLQQLLLDRLPAKEILRRPPNTWVVGRCKRQRRFHQITKSYAGVSAGSKPSFLAAKSSIAQTSEMSCLDSPFEGTISQSLHCTPASTPQISSGLVSTPPPLQPLSPNFLSSASSLINPSSSAGTTTIEESSFKKRMMGDRTTGLQ